MTNYLFVMRGIPGSGKSTFVNNTFMHKANIICPDTLRLQQKEEKGYVSEAKIWKTTFDLLEKSLQENKYTVLDATSTLEHYLNQYNKLCKQYSAQLVIISLKDVPLEVCKKQNAKRKFTNGFVPNDVIERMYKQINFALQGETKQYIVKHNEFNLSDYL